MSDWLHLRRFCLLPLTARVPDESTVPKLVRRLGPEVVAELTRVVNGKACRETGCIARAVRSDSTVVEAALRYRTDGGLAWQGARGLAREAASWPVGWATSTWRVVDRSRRIGKLARSSSRTLVRRTGQRREDVMELNTQAGPVLARSVAQAAGWPPRHGLGRVAAEPASSCAPLGGWRGWPTAASASPPRSSSGRGVSGSPTGWWP